MIELCLFENVLLVFNSSVTETYSYPKSECNYYISMYIFVFYQRNNGNLSCIGNSGQALKIQKVRIVESLSVGQFVLRM